MDLEPTLESLYMFPADAVADGMASELMGKSEHEIHCDKCVNVKKCSKLNVLKCNGPLNFIKCPIVLCRFVCGREFHACKQEEHNFLCSNIKVPCINAGYGCPLVMERRLLGKHLHRCPASVIVCTMEWNRWPLPSDESNAIPYPLDSEQLDTAFLQRDERTALEWWENLPARLRQCLKTALNSKYPVMPLGVAGHRIPECIQTENLLEKVTGSGDGVSGGFTDVEPDDSSETPWGARKAPPGLQESVCNKLTSSNASASPEDFRSSDVKLLADAGVGGECVKEVPRQLNPVVEIVPRSKIKPRNIFTFMCAREFRRDEYAGHFQNVHSDVLTQLNGWLYSRCPLASSGCGFGFERMFPNGPNSRVIYNRDVDAFCTTQIQSNDFLGLNQDIANRDGDSEEERPLSLCDMPFEVLVHLTKYLDPLSLSSLAMVNTLLRKVCAFVVLGRGIVVLQWERNSETGGWEVLERKWLFSTSFSPIRKWTFGDVGRLGNHLRSCPYYERNVPDAPFCYPVKLEDL